MSGVLTNNQTSAQPHPLIVKLSGSAIDAGADAMPLYQTLARLHRQREGGVVIVHGGGAAVDRHLDRIGLSTERRDGIRITPSDQIDEVVSVLAGTVNKRLVGCLQQAGALAVGLCLGDGGLARTVKANHLPFDPGCVGQVSGGDPRVVQTLLQSGFLPVLCSIGLDETGAPLNVNADEAAAGLGAILEATDIILLTDVSGVLDADGELIEELNAAGIDQRIASGEITGGMIPKVRGALEAATASGVPVMIASWKDVEALEHVGAGRQVGTRILPTVSAVVELKQTNHDPNAVDLSHSGLEQRVVTSPSSECA